MVILLIKIKMITISITLLIIIIALLLAFSYVLFLTINAIVDNQKFILEKILELSKKIERLKQ